jgi:hypothetical protein
LKFARHLNRLVYRPIAANIAKLPELMVGRRPGAVRQGVPDNSRVIRPSSASAIFVAEMTNYNWLRRNIGARLSQLGAYIAV